MERRKAVTIAAAASLTMLAGAAGIALNSGIVGTTDDGNVGNLSPIGTSVAPAPTSLDGSVPALGSAPDVLPTDSPPVAASSASGYDDDEDEDDDRHDVDHGDEEDDDQYEGADDDD